MVTRRTRENEHAFETILQVEGKTLSVLKSTSRGAHDLLVTSDSEGLEDQVCWDEHRFDMSKAGIYELAKKTRICESFEGY